MTDEELEELIRDCPRLYHMAERGASEGIRRHGLLSTVALLDLFQIGGDQRDAIELAHRANIIRIASHELGSAAIRDQIPMSDSGLRRALPPNLNPRDWYKRLNSMVFFWLSEARLLRLTGARAYRDIEHEVLVLDTRALVHAFVDKIWLCPINSGCTKPFPHPRDENTFQRVANYDYSYWKSRRRRSERVVELCVDHSLPDPARFIVDAFVQRYFVLPLCGTHAIRQSWRRSPHWRIMPIEGKNPCPHATSC